MSVYVDNMHGTAMGRYDRMRMSHMIADTRKELLEMADKIGVDRRHTQLRRQLRFENAEAVLAHQDEE